MINYIEVIGAKENNLKNVSVKIPKNKLVAITGPSGSGKSSFAMEILQKECQRQYMESMGLVTDGLNKPNVETITGLSPAISVSQRGIGSNSHSTVGTYTEIMTYLRVLYAKIGIRTCEACGQTIQATVNSGTLTDIDISKVTCPNCHHQMDHLTMGMFSFNKAEGICTHCHGLGSVTEIDLDQVVDEDLSISQGAIKIWGNDMFLTYYSEVLEKCGKHYGFSFDASKKIKDFNNLEKLVFYNGVDSEEFVQLFPDIKRPKRVNDGYFKGLLTFMKEKAKENAIKEKKNKKIKDAFKTQTCPVCKGSRLGYRARTVTVGDKTIVDISTYDLNDLLTWLNNLTLNDTEKTIVGAVIADLNKRLSNVIKIGLSYLSLDRPTATLSGGEAQRLKLSNIIDSGLTGVLYILDEPTTGLHAHDGDILLDALRYIRDLGNTVLIIEHDLDFVAQCDHVIDFGPGAGASGGQIIFEGHPKDLLKSKSSITGRYMNKPLKNPGKRDFGKWLSVEKAKAHNLKSLSLDIPLDSLVTFTGLSGSGKSSLVLDVIYAYAKKREVACEGVRGLEHFDKVVAIDQKNIGRMTRSNVATYTEVYALIRTAYASLFAAKDKKLKASHFSFNVKGGRCEKCMGLGVIKLDMHFLDDIVVTCPACQGHRFNDRVLQVRLEGKSITDVLNMTVDQSYEHFKSYPKIQKKLQTLKEVGLGYLQLGQTTITLSGGECQRIKLSKELAKEDGGTVLYILDEPTSGLHVSDIEKLSQLLFKLRDKGHTIFVIEHALELIASSDYVIDLGPRGGQAGGMLINKGRPEDIIQNQVGYTYKYLRTYKESRLL